MQVIIYGKPNCQYCEKAKMLCQIKSIDFQYLEAGRDYNLEELNTLVGHEVRTVPQIFINKDGERKHVGGYEDLRTTLAT